MAIKVNRDDVSPELSELHDVWRLVRRAGPAGIGVGVAAFKGLPTDADLEALQEAHDVPEVHFVLSGEGILLEDGERIPLRGGDAVITPVGARHVLWAISDEPLVTIYVAVSPAATGR